jgi:GNAT superfamily N-acetyltransferase
MGESITYRLLHPGEEREASEMLVRSFQTFVAPDYSDEGVQAILDYIDPDALAERANKNHDTVVAVTNDQIVGLIEIRDHDHISLLFVDENYQRRGISRELLKRTIEMCRIHSPNSTELTVNSSPYAVPIYARLGFEQAGPEEIRNGVRFTPMTLILSHSPVEAAIDERALTDKTTSTREEKDLTDALGDALKEDGDIDFDKLRARGKTMTLDELHSKRESA